VVEQQETAFDEKLKIVTAKYDQVKTINMALQVTIAVSCNRSTRANLLASLVVSKKRLMHALTEGTGKS
jgi:hypothetical protein